MTVGIGGWKTTHEPHETHDRAGDPWEKPQGPSPMGTTPRGTPYLPAWLLATSKLDASRVVGALGTPISPLQHASGPTMHQHADRMHVHHQRIALMHHLERGPICRTN